MEQQPTDAGKQPRPRGVNWDNAADNYNSFVMCELEDTDSYLDLIDIQPTDTVLDVCCGPGRITMLAAKRAAHVTGIDLSTRMLDYARKNVEERRLENVTFQQIDWNCVLPGQNVAVHDIVISSRNGSLSDIVKLSALARKTVMLQIFADAPSIPALQSVLFSGCDAEDGKPFPGPHGNKPAGPDQRPHGMDVLAGRKPSPYVDLFMKAYNAGYSPNVRIMPERFRKTFESKEDAFAWVCSLHPERASGNEDRVAQNTEPFLTRKDGAWEFCIATTAALLWWDVSANPHRHMR